MSNQTNGNDNKEYVYQIRAKLNTGQINVSNSYLTSEWIYPENNLFNIANGEVRLTHYNISSICLATGGEVQIDRGQLRQADLNNFGDCWYILDADIVIDSTNTLYATNITIKDVKTIWDKF